MAGARDFVDYLCRRDAQLTAEAGNKLCESGDTEAEVETAREKALEAGKIGFIIETMSEMRKPGYDFNYLEPQVKTETTTPPQE